jgi:lysophospholipase L1-like esterase
MYVRNLVRFVSELRTKGMKPVFVSSVATGTFAKDGSYWDQRKLAVYVSAMKRAAAEADVPFVDLHSVTLSEVKSLGKEGSKTMYMASVDGKDFTHTTSAGAKRVAELFIEAAKGAGLPFLAK